MKEHHARMPLALANVAKDELDKLPNFVQSCSLVYIPEIGFLLAIPFWKPNVTDEDLLQLENLEYKVSNFCKLIPRVCITVFAYMCACSCRDVCTIMSIIGIVHDNL